MIVFEKYIYIYIYFSVEQLCELQAEVGAIFMKHVLLERLTDKLWLLRGLCILVTDTFLKRYFL